MGNQARYKKHREVTIKSADKKLKGYSIKENVRDLLTYAHKKLNCPVYNSTKTGYCHIPKNPVYLPY